MADTADSIASLVRFIADDQEANWLDTAVQLASINAGYREFQRRMLLRGVPIFRRVTTIDLPAMTTFLSPTDTIVNGASTGATLLPDDFVLPYKIEERVTGGSDDFGYPLEERDWPLGNTPGQFLMQWAWKDGAINFLGATRPITIRLEYGKSLAPLLAPDDAIPVPFAIDAIAWCVLFTVALARGSSDAYRDRCSAMAEQQLDQLTAIHVKRDQMQRRHRRSHLAGRF